MSITSNIDVPIYDVNRKNYVELNKNAYMSIGERIKQARLAADLTQGELAGKVGIKQPTLSALENGGSEGSNYIASFAAALGVNALWLEAGKGPQYPVQNISAKELQLVIAYREASEEGKTFIEMACSSAPKSSR